MISPLLSNIYLHVLDKVWTWRFSKLGTLVRYADDFVVLCGTGKACEEAEVRIREVLKRLGLELHPDKTRRVDLPWGKEGFDFLGCCLRKRMSGPIWEKQRKRVYFLQRCPSPRGLKRVRQRVKSLTGRNRSGVKDVRVLIDELNRVLRGWGNCFRTGNAALKFNETDAYVWKRLRGFMVKRKGRNLRPGEAQQWDRDFFHRMGLHRLRWDRPIRGARVMLRRESPPVSRVPETGMHGLTGVLRKCPRLTARQESRIYQCLLRCRTGCRTSIWLEL